jgi:hypothetical protein
METFDFDNIVKGKLQEENDLHKHELESAKPFIWTAIQSQNKGKKSLMWYHLAAAVTLLVVSFSFFLFSVQKGYKNEIGILSGRIDQLQVDHQSQGEILLTKELQIEALSSELRNVEYQLTDLKLTDLTPKERTIYRTDTIYLKQVEYITVAPDPIEKEVSTGNIADSEAMDPVVVQVLATDEAIYPSYARNTENQQSETIKFKFGTFASRKN